MAEQNPNEISLEAILDSSDLSTLPPGLQSKLDIPKIKEMLQNSKSLSILLTGKTGSGKSTLANGIIGVKMAEEGASVQRSCTMEVQAYTTKKGRIQVTVWDSPGLQDGTDNQETYLQSIKDKCSKVDLTLYCIEISKTRFVRGTDNPDVLAMNKLTEALGPEFWKNAIIVLTFANVLEVLHLSDWGKLSAKKKAKAFETVIFEWESQIHTILEQDVHVPKEIVNKIKVIPAGHFSIRQLPDRDYWLSDLWFECMDTLPTPEAQGALLQINTPRMRSVAEVQEDDFTKEPEAQPIVIPDEKTLTRRKLTESTATQVLTVAGFAGAGGISGATIGITGLIGGPIGVAVAVPAGFLLGTCIGLTLGFHRLSEQEHTKTD